MALVFQHRLAIPLLWAIAFCAVALTAPPRSIPSVTMLLAIALIGLSMMAVSLGRRESRVPAGEVFPAASRRRWYAGIIMTTMNTGVRTRTLEEATLPPTHEPDNVIDLVRMDNHGRWQAQHESRS